MMETDLEERLAKYLSLREALGFPTHYIKPLLRSFIDFLKEHCEDSVIRAQYAIDWSCAKNYSASTQSIRLTTVRVFLIHVRASLPDTEVPDINLIATPRRPEPFIFSEAQLSKLLRVTALLSSTRSIDPLTIQTMFGLMACAGLRPSEAIKLKTADVVLDEQPRLLIECTKFYKSRWVPLHTTTAKQLSHYLRFRLGMDNAASSETCFASKTLRQIKYLTLQRTFQDVIKLADIHPRNDQLRPTLQSLRHTFAVQRLRYWYEAGEDVQALVPTLSVYLGHVDPAESYWYLSATPELMAAAAQRFETYAGRETMI